MKKKIFNFLMIAVLFAASSSVFVSCKDNVSDENLEDHKMIVDNLKQLLDQKEQALKQEMAAIVEQQKKCQASCQEAMNALERDIENLKNNEIESLKTLIANLQAQDAVLNTAIIDIKSTLANVQISIENNKNDIHTLFTLHNTLSQTVIDVQNLAQSAMDIANSASNLANEAKQIADKNKQDIANLNQTITEINNRLTNIETEISNLQNNVSQIWATAEAAYAQAMANKDLLVVIQNKFANYYTIEQIDSMKAEINANIKTATDAALEAKKLATEVYTLAEQANTKALEAYTKANEALSKVLAASEAAQNAFNKAMEARDSAIAAKAQAILAQEKADKAQGDAQAAQQAANEAKAKAQAAQDKADNAWNSAQQAITAAAAAQGTADAAKALADANKIEIGNLETSYKEADKLLQNQVNTLNEELEQVKEKVNSALKELGIIKSDLAKMITSILVQDITNPVIGSLITPFGLETNILCAFYGEATQDVDFPVDALGVEAYNLIGCTESFMIYNGETLVENMEEGKAYVGKVYTTINPNTVNFEGEKLTLETSAGNASPFILEPLKKSDKEIMFGYTRADNGFYEADAYVTYEDIYSASLNKAFRGTGLKSLAKDILNKIKDVKKNKDVKGGTNDINLADAYKTILNAASNILPAYALKATWTDSAQTKHSIFSNYNIAATSVRPASYEFLKDWNAPEIPLIGHINFDIDFHFDYPSYQTLDNPNLELTVYIVYLNVNGIESVIGVYSNEAEAEAKKAEYPGAWVKSMQYTVSGLNSFIEEINENVILELAGDIEDLESQIVKQAQDNVNDALAKVNNNVIDRINKIIKNINLRLDNANHYLQPTMLYQGGDGDWYIMSNVKNFPTVVKGTGGMIIEPTSLTAEVFAPAFKKFIAVTNVWKNGNESVSAKAGDPTCKAALNAANGATNMCKVLSGAEDVLFHATQSGYTYEISYAAVDYSGKVVCRKFYVKAI